MTLVGQIVDICLCFTGLEQSCDAIDRPGRLNVLLFLTSLEQPSMPVIGEIAVIEQVCNAIDQSDR